MSTFLRVDVNIIAMVFLGVVLLIANGRLDKSDPTNRIFMKMSVSIFLLLLVETITCIINGHPGKIVKITDTLLHMILFIAGPVLTFCAYQFISNLISASETRVRKKIFRLPLFINALIVFLTPFFHWVFYFDSSNCYHRGPCFLLSIMLIYFYMVWGIILVIKYRAKLMKQELILLLTLSLLPLAGGVMQSFFYPSLGMWSSAALASIIAYILLQQRMVHLDDLTGAWNRKSFENYMPGLKDRRFGMIYFDLDQLKRINDKFGHHEGDFALKTAVELIRKVLDEEDIIVRMGGDEFLIIVNSNARKRLDNIIEKAEAEFEQYNKTSEKSYDIRGSFGADLFDPEMSDMDLEQFIRHVDQLMYQRKKAKRNMGLAIEYSGI